MPHTATETYRKDPAWAGLADEATVAATRPMNTVTSPIDGAALGEVPIGTPDDVHLAVTRARQAAKAWSARPIDSRVEIIERFRAELSAHRDALLDIAHAESGKAQISAFEEFLDLGLTCSYYAAKAPKILKRHRRIGALPVLTSAYVHYVPKGVVGIIAPWNYPLTLAVSDSVPALLAGNAVVLKPDSLTPLTALLVLRLARQAGLPHDVMQIVTGPGRELGDPLIDSSDFIMFTGSTATGRKVAARAGQQLIGVSAELGGKNALLVLEDAPLARTVAGAVQASFANSGQLCISIERIYVARPLFEWFANSFASAAEELVLGGSNGWEVDMGPLISADQLAKVTRHVEDAVAKGATVLTGGKPRPDLGPLFYEPTVLTGVTDAMELAREETFGPVVALYPVDSDEEAIALANDTEYGLNASVWTSNPARGRRVAEALRAGTVNINEGYAATWGSIDAPMGGFGISGLGRRHGMEGLVKYTEPQTVARQRLLAIGPPEWVPRDKYVAAMSVASTLLYPTVKGLVRRVFNK